MSMYRLTRDRQWIEKHRELLVECAEWTIEQRRKTVELVDGERPLHWGLLPKWSYGGDIAGLQCYASSTPISPAGAGRRIPLG